MPTYKLSVKIGANEFHGEGPEAAVRHDYEEWRELLSRCGVLRAGPQPPGELPRNRHSSVSRAFDNNGRAAVALRVLPPPGERREAEAILLILYGTWLINSATEVPVIDLKQSLRQSGIRVLRVDRAVSRIVADGLLSKGGSGKGGRYSLTTRGREAAAALLERLAPPAIESDNDSSSSIPGDGAG